MPPDPPSINKLLSTTLFFADKKYLKYYYNPCPLLTLQLSRLPPLDENPKWNPAVGGVSNKCACLEGMTSKTMARSKQKVDFEVFQYWPSSPVEDWRPAWYRSDHNLVWWLTVIPMILGYFILIFTVIVSLIIHLVRGGAPGQATGRNYSAWPPKDCFLRPCKWFLMTFLGVTWWWCISRVSLSLPVLIFDVEWINLWHSPNI